ncbi:hypothetical protein ASE14_04210 [Agromyces sp. Root81]|uniref:hypothetical protein n=1 Tax=Agromyces sp. Root81 TaxID=1736601 RepID=UPI0006F1E037|nr:hypothetical protein [Agromyces sp. Root81]KRC63001.1 hypothetical protein ASE14_04210 [Agromyces sp. Root81]
MKSIRMAAMALLVTGSVLGLTACAPSEYDGLAIDSDAAGCFSAGGGDDVMLQLPVRSDGDRVPWAIERFQLVDAPTSHLVGVDVLGPSMEMYSPGSLPSRAVRSEMERNRSEEWLDRQLAADADSTVVVILDRAVTDGSDSRLRIYFGGGEPVYYQDVLLDAIDGCSAAAHR